MDFLHTLVGIHGIIWPGGNLMKKAYEIQETSGRVVFLHFENTGNFRVEDGMLIITIDGVIKYVASYGNWASWREIEVREETP